MLFVANFIGFLALKNFEGRLIIGRVIASYMREGGRGVDKIC